MDRNHMLDASNTTKRDLGFNNREIGKLIFE